MTGQVSGSELELGNDEQDTRDPARQHRAVVVQRVAWVVLALIVLGALLGLFGPGPLSRVTQSDPSGQVALQYERFARYYGDTSVELQVRHDPHRPGTASVWISSDYLTLVQVQQVRPEPATWTGVGDRVLLTFPVRGPDPITVVLRTRPDQVGVLSGSVGAPGGKPIEFWQLVYP